MIRLKVQAEDSLSRTMLRKLSVRNHDLHRFCKPFKCEEVAYLINKDKGWKKLLGESGKWVREVWARRCILVQ